MNRILSEQCVSTNISVSGKFGRVGWGEGPPTSYPPVALAEPPVVLRALHVEHTHAVAGTEAQVVGLQRLERVEREALAEWHFARRIRANATPGDRVRRFVNGDRLRREGTSRSSIRSRSGRARVCCSCSGRRALLFGIRPGSQSRFYVRCLRCEFAAL